MADLIDRAADLEERHRAAALAAQQERARACQAADAPDPARRRDCCDCGGAIPRARLAARPYTLRCTPCQALQERAHVV